MFVNEYPPFVPEVVVAMIWFELLTRSMVQFASPGSPPESVLVGDVARVATPLSDHPNRSHQSR